MDNESTTRELLEFEVAFPHEEKLTVEQYLSGGCRKFVLNAAAFFLGFKNHHSKFADNRKTLGLFLPENSDLVNDVYKRIEEVEKKDIQIDIINPYSSLKIFEYYFSKSEEPETQTPAEFEVNLFKSYLVLNSEFTQKQNFAIQSTKESEEDLKIPMMWFCMRYPVADKTNYDLYQIWATQMVKSIYLFEFLESQEKTKPLLAAFLTHFNCTTWKEYLTCFLPLTTPALMNKGEAHTDIIVNSGTYFEKICVFIEKLIVQHDEPDPNDFITLRSKPLYKVEEGVYRIIFSLFVVEKIFKGLYFLLRDINKTLPEPTGIEDLKSLYVKNFSEEILCCKVMESIYPDKCIRFSGKQLTDMKIDAAPDYYVRKGKNILLIESRDFLIAPDKKMSFDYPVYTEEFGRILDYEEMPDGKIKPKAVMQLINTIRRILKNEFSADNDYHYKDIHLYPVLLTHDHQYDVPGFNELIDFWFQDELPGLKEEGLFIYHVKPLAVVNIDSLIYNQVGLANDTPLHEILNLYHKQKKDGKEKRIFEYAYLPFSFFINDYFSRQGLGQQPPLWDLLGSILFNKEKTLSPLQGSNKPDSPNNP